MPKGIRCCSANQEGIVFKRQSCKLTKIKTLSERVIAICNDSECEIFWAPY
jgi:hypothetical protein